MENYIDLIQYYKSRLHNTNFSRAILQYEKFEKFMLRPH